ncbi:type IX secretion system plug protein [Arcticibacterium luteifluviistationis]|uniref:Type 9 secretion system plug protein N-terminal domain-containing protein n=1 Tax=Arcticibacterium luteifluviistationis TaxID=1784714 RepID=A0A2Z4GBV5_9BACT|nr:DUF5103 domain-containing protein [Arcticibacterium luteifluviistationis]AWV98687.1 hypothetical protein DJ013_11090 [Arcticibacterium luteifluviistationis]
MKKILIVLILKIIGFQAFSQTYERTDNKVYDTDIKTVQLYAFGNGAQVPGLSSRVLSLNSNDRMVLEFDDLRGSYRQFHVKIQHCNLDWTESRLSALEYLTEFNDFIINDYQISQNTKIPYFHYGFILPQLKISGNYTLLLYEDYLSDSPLASLHFSVVNPQVGISANIQRAQDPALWQTHEQVDFELSYGNYQVSNPRNDFQIFIRQNYRLETTKAGFKASSVNAGRRTLSYRFFDNENVFPAGNEFRYVDLRSNFNKGGNIAEIQQGYEDNVWLIPQRSRAQLTYLESVDLNGRFVIQTLDGDEPSINADYMHVHAAFNLEKLRTNEKVCLLGGFNQFDCNNGGELFYNAEIDAYETTFMLKQGMYDFQFALVDQLGKADFSVFEGDFSNTKNSYEIFVYHKPPGAKSELLVGYTVIEE